MLTTSTGSWHAVFYTAAAMNAVAAVLSLTVLKPMRARQLASDGNGEVAPAPSAPA
jgi:OFA family oxalate/formate antiporter-like MFS transporter